MDADHFMIDGTFKTSLDRIDSAWRFLKPLIPADMDDFVNYFERTWIGTSTQGPRFEHSKWNHYDDIQPLLPRSSNIVEGWHHGFHSMMGCTYPTIWKFLDCLTKEQNLTDVKITQHMMRQPPPRYRRERGSSTTRDLNGSVLDDGWKLL